MFSRPKLLAAAAAALMVGACETAPIGSPDVSFGESVKYDAAIQTINPDPVYSAQGAQPGDSGDKSAAASKRYRSGDVKPVETMETTSSTSGSGGSH
ncbi:MAG: hypothetical protein ACJ8EY_01175 [Sphingomicrobium sp.]